MAAPMEPASPRPPLPRPHFVRADRSVSMEIPPPTGNRARGEPSYTMRTPDAPPLPVPARSLFSEGCDAWRRAAGCTGCSRRGDSEPGIRSGGTSTGLRAATGWPWGRRHHRSGDLGLYVVKCL
ncbi:hypothetical protein HispidOSU_024730 [Sigmodon hispidus]